MQADTDVIRGNEFDAFMQPQAAAPNVASPSVGTRARAAADSSRSVGAPAASASNHKTMIAVAVVALVLAVAAVYTWFGGLFSPKPLPPEVAAVVAAADRPAPATALPADHQAASSASDLPAPIESPSPAESSVPVASPAASESPAPTATPAAVAPPAPAPTAVAPPAPVATPDLAATLESRERELALLRNALANERAARARAERSQARGGTVTAVLRDGVVVRDANGNDRVVGVGQRTP